MYCLLWSCYCLAGRRSPLGSHWDCAAEKNQMRSQHCLSSPLLSTICLSQSTGMHTQGRVSASRTCVLWRPAPGGRKPSDGTLKNREQQPPSPSRHVMAYMGLWSHVVMFVGCSGRLVWAFGIMSFQLIIYTNTTSYMYNLGPPSSVGPRLSHLLSPLEPALLVRRREWLAAAAVEGGGGRGGIVHAADSWLLHDFFNFVVWNDLEVQTKLSEFHSAENPKQLCETPLYMHVEHLVCQNFKHAALCPI